jgi:hypothetical protein
VPQNHQVVAYKFPHQALQLEKLSLHLFGGLTDHDREVASATSTRIVVSLVTGE